MSTVKREEVLGGWCGEMGPLFPGPQLYQVQLACVSKSTDSALN